MPPARALTAAAMLAGPLLGPGGALAQPIADRADVERAVTEHLGGTGLVRFFGLEARRRPDAEGRTIRVVCGRVARVDPRGGLSAALPFVYRPDGSVKFRARRKPVAIGTALPPENAYARYCLR